MTSIIKTLKGGPKARRSRHAAPERRRRRLRWAIGVLALVLLFYGAGGWYFSDQLRAELTPKPNQREYFGAVTGISADSVTIAKADPADGELFTPGLYGLFWDAGHGTVGQILAESPTEVTRRYTLLAGEALGQGTPVDVDPWVYPDDGRPAPGLDFEPVEYQSPLGPMDAVFVPGTSDTWVVVVHGRNATPREAYRLGSIVSAEGYPWLAITHRNDGDQPADPSGYIRFGATEWEDLEGAVGYALESGAQDVILAGLSTGAAAVLGFLENSELADHVSALVLDAPNIDFGTVVTYGASQRDLPVVGLPVPASLAWSAKTIASVRFGVDWGEIDYVSRADRIEVPVLVFQGAADPSVPVSISRELASQRPDLVTLVEVDGARHVQSWNADPGRYEREVGAFLGGL